MASIIFLPGASKTLYASIPYYWNEQDNTLAVVERWLSECWTTAFQDSPTDANTQGYVRHKMHTTVLILPGPADSGQTLFRRYGLQYFAGQVPFIKALFAVIQTPADDDGVT